MAKIYYRQILNRKLTIHDVPQRWREQVKKLLEINDKE